MKKIITPLILSIVLLAALTACATAGSTKHSSSSLGVKLRFETMPSVDLVPALEEGKMYMVMSGMTMTADRSARVALVADYAVCTLNAFLYYRSALFVPCINSIHNDKYHMFEGRLL